MRTSIIPRGLPLIAALAAVSALSLGSCDESSMTLLSSADGGEYALVVTTDYEVGSFAVIDADDLSVQVSEQVIHQDAVCRFDPLTGTPFLVSRLGADAVEVIDPSNGWAITGEYSVGAGTNPQDIAVASETRAFISRQQTSELLVVRPDTGVEQGSVDLSSYADQDGVPEAGWMLARDGKIFVALNKLEGFLPAEKGSVLVLDSPSGVPSREIETTGSNLYGLMRYDDTFRGIVLVECGVFGEGDGGVEILDTTTSTVSGFLITEEELGGDLVDAVILSEHKGYAIIGVPIDEGQEMKTRLVSFDPSKGKVIETIIDCDGWDLGFMELSPDKATLWVTDRTPEQPGIRIVDTSTDQQHSATPIDTGLPPFMICFVETEEAR